MSALPQPAPVCASCGHALTGRFCAVCGEERLDFHNLSVRHFLAHTLHEVFELDGKIWLTLRGLLFRPAFLPSEYCGGRRRRYVNPFRLLITAAIAYALASRGGLQVRMFIGPVNVSLAPTAVTEGTSITATVERIDRFHLLRGLLAQREKSPAIESEAVRDKFHRQVEKFAEPLSFANVLLLAVMLYGLFGLRRKHFVEHGVFSMHFMSFVLFTALLFAPVPALMRAGWSTAVLPLIAAVVVWQFIYLVVAIRRFYFGPRIKDVLPKLAAGFGAVAVYFLNSVFITCVQTLGAALALWSTVP